MANQYSQSFEIILQRKYGKPTHEVLQMYCDEGLSYEDVASKFGFKSTTVRKWCRKYNVELLGPTEINSAKAYETLYQSSLSAVTVNTYNVLYRSWAINHKYFTTFKRESS
ncbi:helix-turn-helix domain-containing protein [Fangia hongkongensis]|uniref:helix-turn-helix domain-containing protein n=1 Tax=Fangia hongkongensis TaxID=270495 RepID=UPI000372AEF4|nr:helix-turn-helix domain-containing protein [Fangia hongkongensis]MBK2125760.1 helix-turn-helix domain-containing protein [Fangia hongkongensis]